MLDTAQGSGLPPQLETLGTMPELLVRARGSRGGYAAFQRPCTHTKDMSARNPQVHSPTQLTGSHQQHGAMLLIQRPAALVMGSNPKLRVHTAGREANRRRQAFLADSFTWLALA